MRPDRRAWIPGLVVLSTALACWPVWIWYGQRFGDTPDDRLGLAALILLFVLSARRPDERPAPATTRWGLLPSLIAVGAYAITFPFVPRLASAALAFLALAFSWSLWRHGTPFRPWAVGLGVLGLPMASSLQFYFGYPLRVASGAVALVLLRAGGIAAVRDGVMLRWGETLVLVDAPCSGIRMLWAALLLACCLAALFRLRARASVLAAGAAGAMAIAGNGLRAAALFWADTGLAALPPRAHGAVGAGVFLSMAAGLVALVRWLARSTSSTGPHPVAGIR
jgi:exosortase/archaeosortase family protein